MGSVVSLGGDPYWLEVHRELKALHIRKSSTYGTPDEPFANFLAVAASNGCLPEEYVLDRVVEKLTRARNMIRAGDADAVKEYPDGSSLLLCAEALRRRRSP